MPFSDQEDFSCRKCHLTDEVRSFQTIRNLSLKQNVSSIEPLRPEYIVPYLPIPPQTGMPLPGLTSKIVIFNIIPLIIVFGGIVLFSLINFPNGLNGVANGPLIEGTEFAILGVSIGIIVWTNRIFTKRAKNTPEFLAWMRENQELPKIIERQRLELKEAADRQYQEEMDRWRKAHNKWEVLCENLYCCERCARFFFPNSPVDVPSTGIRRLLN